MTENKLIRKFVETAWTQYNKLGADVLKLDLATKCIKKAVTEMTGCSD